MSKFVFGIVGLLVGLLVGLSSTPLSIVEVIDAQPIQLVQRDAVEAPQVQFVEVTRLVLEQCAAPAPVAAPAKTWVRPERSIGWTAKVLSVEASSTTLFQELVTSNTVVGSSTSTTSVSPAVVIENLPANCGVGNGVDGDRPGCLDGRNDGPGFTPGWPGARGGNGNN